MIPKLNLKEQPELVLKLTNANRDKEMVLRYSIIEYDSTLYILDEDGTTLYLLNKNLESLEEFCRQQSTTRFEYRTFYFRNSSGEDITEKFLNQTNKTPQVRKWGTPNRKKEVRDHTITIRVSEREKETIDNIVWLYDTTITDFVRKAITNYIDILLKDDDYKELIGVYFRSPKELVKNNEEIRKRSKLLKKWGTPNRKLQLNGEYLELSDMSKGVDMKLDRALAYSIIKSLKEEFNISEEVK